MRALRSLALAALLSSLPVVHASTAGAQSQDAPTASLMADRISIDGDRVLVAEGSVEVIYEGARLTASRVTYDRSNGSLTIEGPLVLSEGEGTIILASSAELDTELRTGILRSARLVLDRQLQLAAAEIQRGAGRYTRLSRVIASSCEICDESDVPIWEIRAARVIRDAEERQLYFDEAQVRVAGVPVFYIPRLRLPGPTLERATGVLVPSIRNRSQLGTGIVWPYFIRISDRADATIAPYLSSETKTLEALYRHEFAKGSLVLQGAASRDSIRPGETRAYLFAEGSFALPRDLVLAFDAELVSDRSYLFDYGYSERDRLDSEISISRVRDDQLLRTAVTSFRTLRAADLSSVDEVPDTVFEFELSQRLTRDPVWGQLWVTASAMGLSRPASTPGTGRDTGRVGVALDWRTSGVLAWGIVAEAEARVAFDHYQIAQDPAFGSDANRFAQSAAVALRWPLAATDAGGARNLLEPIVQLAWGNSSGDPVPNEDSTLVEFDEGNLDALSRFPGVDRVEEGLRLNLGLAWTRYDPDGWSVGATVGRIVRFEDENQFSARSGLTGSTSDWLFAVHYRLGDRLSVTSRTTVDDNLDVSRSETRLEWVDDWGSLAGTHLWRAADPGDVTIGDLSELTLDASYAISDFWTATAGWRLDADRGETTRAALGLRYQNECVGFDLSLSRRFTSSSNIEPATELDFRVFLVGFGTNGDGRRSPSRCRG